MKTNFTKAEFELLIARFEKRTLPKEEWTHEAHLAAGTWYLWNNSFEKALDLTRENISRYNESVGGENTDTSGYHETITKAWLLLLQMFLKPGRFNSPVEACNAFITHDAGHMHYLKHFYSKEHLLNPHARKHWVEPDLRALEINLGVISGF